MHTMNRIALIGSGGSGKSTLAMDMGKILGLEVRHLDAILWKPNWILTPREEQKQIQSQLVNQQRWIIDGNYQSTLDIRLEAADTIIFLDMPRTLCLYRVLKRRLMYHNRTRPDMQSVVRRKSMCSSSNGYGTSQARNVLRCSKSLQICRRINKLSH